MTEITFACVVLGLGKVDVTNAIWTRFVLARFASLEPSCVQRGPACG